MNLQAELVASWMSIGFIHGVMNTDNIAISGQTLDYGPCAFIDEYESNKVFSFIDKNDFSNKICYTKLINLNKIKILKRSFKNQ